MAVDETILNSAISLGICSVRIYRWKEPTVSLGHFQDPSEIKHSERLSQLPIVRRLSGGGALVHQFEFTYSCAVPRWNTLTQEPSRIYTVVHEGIISWCNNLGIAARLRGKMAHEKSGEFLCFGRGDDFDGVVGEFKVLGSAQRRRQGAILQHGSLLLRRSPFVPDFPGILDLSDDSVCDDSLFEGFSNAVSRIFGNDVMRSALSQEEISLATSIEPRVTVHILPDGSIPRKV
jgi:lipoate-protein ligase A